MDLLSLLRLVSGADLLALLRLVWRWVRPAQHRRATVHDLQLRDCTAPTFVSGSAAYSNADSKTFSGAASSSTTASMKRRSDSNNAGAFPSSLAADPKNLRKIADADDSLAAPKDPKDMDADPKDSKATDADTKNSEAPTSASDLRLRLAADPKNLRKIADADDSLAAPKDPKDMDADPKDSKATDADTKNSKAPTSASSASLSGAGYYVSKNVATAKNGSTSLSGAGSKNADALSSSLAANPHSAFHAFTAARATAARASRWGSTTTSTLFHADCPHCEWTGRVSMSDLFTHARRCRHRRFAMEQKLRKAQAEKQARAREVKARLKKR